MPKVIVNSTPLIVLCGIGRLDILRELYREIFIPTAVYAGGHGGEGFRLYTDYDAEKLDPCGKNTV